MAIYKLENGTYRVVVNMGRHLDGSRSRATKICKTKMEAECVERRMLLEKGEGLAQSMTLADFVDTYWWPMKESQLAQSSLDSYEQDLRLRILPALGAMNLRRIDRFNIQLMLNRCSTEKTARRARDVLRAILNEAVQCNLINSNPAIGRFAFPEGGGVQGGVWLTTFEEHRDILQAAQGAGEVEKILILGLCFGLRKGEILALDWADVDFKRMEVHVHQGYVKTSRGNKLKTTKTPKSVRTIPMPVYAARRLEELEEELPKAFKNRSVVQARTGGRLSPNTATKMLKRWVIANNQPQVTMQTLRHSFASACISAGINIAKVSAWLGHTNITTTYNRYVKTKPEDLAAEMSVIDKILGA